MRRRTKTKAVLAIIGFVVIVAAIGLVLHYIETRADSKSGGGGEDNGKYLYLGDHEYEITHNLETYLLIGSDDSGNEAVGGSGDGSDKKDKNKKYHGGMADFILLVVLDKTDNTYGFLPIDRNTIVDMQRINDKGEEGTVGKEQICTARWYGKDPEQGCENTADAVDDLLGGLEIDGYYSINMHDIATLNHAVGGVTVTIEDDFTDTDPEMAPGKTMKLTDEQAETFVRGRMEVGDGTNKSRMRRQKAFMEGFKQAAKKKMDENPDFANDLYQTLKDTAVTNTPASRVSKIANLMYKGKSLGIIDIEGKTKEGTTLKDGKVHEEFYPDENSIIKAMTKLCGLEKRGKI